MNNIDLSIALFGVALASFFGAFLNIRFNKNWDSCFVLHHLTTGVGLAFVICSVVLLFAEPVL